MGHRKLFVSSTIQKAFLGEQQRLLELCISSLQVRIVPQPCIQFMGGGSPCGCFKEHFVLPARFVYRANGHLTLGPLLGAWCV